MVEEEALLRVQCGDGGQVFGDQLEVEDVEVLDDPFLPDLLRDNNHLPLNQPAQDDLGDRFPVLSGDGPQ